MTRPTDWGLSFKDQIALRMWPDISNGGDLLDIVQIARDCLSKSDLPHALVSVLVHQQLVEEFLLVIDYWCFYEKALALYPVHLAYNEPGRLMFGGLQKRIEQNQDFPGKTELLQACKELADCRNPLVHRLTDRQTFNSIQETSQAAVMNFEAALVLFKNSQTYFFGRFEQLADRTGIPDRRQAK